MVLQAAWYDPAVPTTVCIGVIIENVTTAAYRATTPLAIHVTFAADFRSPVVEFLATALALVATLAMHRSVAALLNRTEQS